MRKLMVLLVKIVVMGCRNAGFRGLRFGEREQRLIEATSSALH